MKPKVNNDRINQFQNDLKVSYEENSKLSAQILELDRMLSQQVFQKRKNNSDLLNKKQAELIELQSMLGQVNDKYEIEIIQDKITNLQLYISYLNI
ncbi:hypothetical protein pb186bvf_008066 [Paramecium bursaria]